MTITVSPTAKEPSHDIKLSDGVNSVGIVLTDAGGKRSINALRRFNQLKTALKTQQGNTKYSDFEEPYMAIAQDDWSGGRGSEDLDDDRTRFFDSYRLITSNQSGVILGGQETYGSGFRDMLMEWPGSVYWQRLYGSDRYQARAFTTVGGFNTHGPVILVRKVGSPGSLTAEIWSSSGGNIGAMLVSGSRAASGLVYDDVTSEQFRITWTGGSLYALAGATTYYLVVYGAGTDDGNNHWEIAIDTSATGIKSADGVTWPGALGGLYYRINDTSFMSNAAYGYFTPLFFEYKRGLYMVNVDDGDNDSYVWLNGDRGAADSNSGDKTYLNDATKSWTTDEWAGCVVQIINGPGSDEAQSWRTIVGNGATALQVDPDWEIVHTTSTEYVILGANSWKKQFDCNKRATSVAVADDRVYIAFGESGTNITRYREYNAAGVWTIDTASDVIAAKHLLAIRHPEEGYILWGSRNDASFHGVSVFKANVPKRWGDLYTDYGTMLETDTPWDDKVIANVTQGVYAEHTSITIAAGFTTGIAALKNLPTPVDMTRAKRLGFLINSSVATASGDLKLRLYDQLNGDREHSPNGLKMYDKTGFRAYSADSVLHHDGSAFADMENAYDGDTGTSYTDASGATSHRIYVGYANKFSTITVDLGTVNANASVMTCYYWNGSAWTALTLADHNWADGTISSGKTLAQDGSITFNAPGDWSKNTVNSLEYYWIRITWNNAITDNMTWLEVRVRPDEFNVYWRDLGASRDGGTATATELTWTAESYLYIGSNALFDTIDVNIGTTPNAVATSSLTVQYFNGSAWIDLTITDGTASGGITLAVDGDITFTCPHDWEQYTADNETLYWVRIKSNNKALTNLIDLIEIKLQNAAVVELTIPLLAVSNWQWASIDITPTRWPLPNDASIKSVALYVAVDNGAQTILLADGLHLTSQMVDYTDIGGDSNITNITVYSGGTEDPRANPWVITENQVYEIQTQNNNIAVPIPLGEISALRSSYNGKVFGVNDVYLYFNLGPNLERYFNRNLDDEGPNREAGLPANRQGIPHAFVSYPGKPIISIAADEGSSTFQYISSVLELANGWHELYRGRGFGQRIRSLYVQSLPNSQVQRLWMGEGGELVWIPIALNPYYDSNFRYTHEGHLESGWIYGGLQDIIKMWHSLKVFLENVTTDSIYIKADYKVDNENDSWTEISGLFDTVPVEELDFSTATPPNVTGRRIKYRLRFYTSDNTKTPRLKATVVEGIGGVPIKYAYTFTFMIREADIAVDLEGGEMIPHEVASTFSALVDGWARNATPLTFNSVFSIANNVTIKVDPMGIQPVMIDTRMPSGKGREGYYAQLTVYEL